MPKLIGIAGKAGSGKDTMADYLWERHAFLKLAFADPVKLAASEMFGLDLSVFYDREKKEVVDTYWGLSPRQMMQQMGQGMKPVFGNEVWLKRWMKNFRAVHTTDNVVVPDVRFEIEAALIRSLGGYVIHLERDNAGLTESTGRDVSERGIAWGDTDSFVMNNHTKQDLYVTIETLVGAL